MALCDEMRKRTGARPDVDRARPDVRIEALFARIAALPDLDANANAIAIQTLKLENEGWERDLDVVEPSEPVLAG